MRVNSIVRFTKESAKEYAKLLNCDKSSHFIYLGDIVQMPGHGIFLGCYNPEVRGKMFSGYHTDSFEEVPKEEV
jgi:hypothetical protein